MLPLFIKKEISRCIYKHTIILYKPPHISVHLYIFILWFSLYRCIYIGKYTTMRLIHGPEGFERSNDNQNFEKVMIRTDESTQIMYVKN